jgi:hypothetical protein
MLQRFERMEEQMENQKRAEKRMRTHMAKEVRVSPFLPIATLHPLERSTPSHQSAKVEAATNSFLMTAVSSQAARRRAFEENRKMVEAIGFQSPARTHSPFVVFVCLFVLLTFASCAQHERRKGARPSSFANSAQR